MIERKFVAQKLKEYEIEEFISSSLKRVGHSHTRMVRTPLGEKIIIHTSRPGLIVGKKGQNIKRLTKTLKVKFGLENPQIEIAEVADVSLNPQIIAEKISNSLERFGTAKFKGIGHKILTEVIGAGALGIEVVISGKIPSARAKRWRFYQGYLKKSGDIAVTQIKKAYATAGLKTGIVGIQVRIMTPDIILPDKIKVRTVEEVEAVKAARLQSDASEKIVKESSEETEESESDVSEKKPKKSRSKKAVKANDEVEAESDDESKDKKKKSKQKKSGAADEV